MKQTTRSRELLRSGQSLVVPGCYNALSARILAQVGFPALYMTGYGTSLSLLGMPDAGLADLHTFAGFDQIRAWEEAFLPPEELGKYEDSVGHQPSRS